MYKKHKNKLFHKNKINKQKDKILKAQTAGKNISVIKYLIKKSISIYYERGTIIYKNEYIFPKYLSKFT